MFLAFFNCMRRLHVGHQGVLDGEWPECDPIDGEWSSDGEHFASETSEMEGPIVEARLQSLRRAWVVKILEDLAAEPAFKLLDSLRNQWTQPSGSKASGWDTVLYILRQLARAFSSHEHFTEMVNVTGARNSGKSHLVALVQKFLGDGFFNYAGTLPSDYLNKPRAERAVGAADSGRNPALAA